MLHTAQLVGLQLVPGVCRQHPEAECRHSVWILSWTNLFFCFQPQLQPARTKPQESQSRMLEVSWKLSLKGLSPKSHHFSDFQTYWSLFNTKHSQKNSQNFWNAYFGILGVKNTWTRSKPKSSATKSHWSYPNVAKLTNEINKWIVI